MADLPTPETVILGTHTTGLSLTGACPPPVNLIDCIPADTASHNGGVRVDVDGTLWVSIGDANLGTGEPNRFRPYDERSYAGKILHVDRHGRGLPRHPFCPSEANLAAIGTKVHAKGLRNPLRMALRGGGRTPLVGDVGQAEREELDAVEAGANYGWPCYEGDIRMPSFQTTTRASWSTPRRGPGMPPSRPSGRRHLRE